MNDIRDGHYTLGHAYLKNSQYAEAITHFEVVLKLDPDFIDAYHAIALAYFGQHDIQSAKDAVQEALKLDPTYKPAQSLLQAIEPQYTPTEIQMPPTTVTTQPETIPTIVETEPDFDTDKESKRGLVFLNNKQYPQAEATFKKIIKQSPNDAIPHYNLAQTYLEMGAYNDAQNEVAIALRLSPQYQPAHQLQNAIDFLKKREKQKQVYKKSKRYLIPIAIVAVIGVLAVNMGWLTSLLPEKMPPKLSIDTTLEDPNNKNGYIDASEIVRIRLTITNSGSTAKNLKVGVSPKTIGGLRLQIPERTFSLRKNQFETVRIPITADSQARTRKVPIKIEILDKNQIPIANTDFQLNIKSN